MVEIIKKDEDRGDKALIDSIDLDQLREGNKIFGSQGFSRLKVTHDGVVKTVTIPIKSSGISEMMDEFERTRRPQPPKKRDLVKKDSDLGREMRLTKNEYAWVYDLTDEAYVKELDEYSRDLGMKVLMMGLNLPIVDKEGEPIEDDERKLAVLKGMGFTGDHLNKLVDDIRSLTQWQEDRENDFLGF